MPYKEIYWKNPEKHRKESSERQKKLRKLGYHGGMTNIARYLKKLLHSSNYRRVHRADRPAYKVSRAKWKAKCRAATGGTTARDSYLFKLLGGAGDFNKKLLQLPKV